MNVLDQFKQDFLDTLESENKEQIVGAFGEVVNVFNETIQRRDAVSGTNRELKAKINDIATALNLGEDFQVEDIKSVLEGSKGADEATLRDEISAKFEEKYSNDMKTLTTQLEELKTQNGDITNKYNDTLFVNAVVNSGLLDNFVDDKDARDSIIIPRIKDKLLYKDGQVFVKDETTGDVATKLGTNEPLSPASVVDSLKTSISPIYLKAQSQANGMGIKSNQTHVVDGGGKPDTSKYKDVSSAMADGFASLNQ